ncbi:MAG: hypothetical protein MUF11_07500 [Beijerinckiaceae bacterium]|nr:hypothetical protein [Beijerinckiaceae bacterium]
MEKPDLLILGLDRQGLEIGLAVATLGGQVIVAYPEESATRLAIRDGEVLARLPDCTDLAAFEAHRKAILEDIRRQRSQERLRAARIRVETGPARFLDKRRVAIGDVTFQPRRVLLATGCGSAAPQAELLDLLERGVVPRRLILRGGAAAALDLASLLVRLGSQVTLVSETPVAPDLDADATRLLLGDLERRGLVRLTGMPPARPADLPVWEIGAARPVIEDLDLEKAGIRLKNGRLVLKNGFETGNSCVFAVGRVANPDSLPDASAVAHLVGRLFFRRSGRYQPMPALRLVGGDPGIAAIGLTEREALARGGAQIARAAFADADPADVSGGFVKLMADRKGRLLGACLFGPRAAENIAPLTLALAQGLTLSEIARLNLPPGRASEAIRLAAASPARGLLRSSKVQRAFRFFRMFG